MMGVSIVVLVQSVTVDWFPIVRFGEKDGDLRGRHLIKIYFLAPIVSKVTHK